MAQVCRRCSRKNPDDASFCYFDGALLVGPAAGPLNAGAQPFPNAFHFSAGFVCRNFDQLAMTCQNHWPAALELLKQGIFAVFFAGIGRLDLAGAAEEARRFPDPDRGLDQLLGKLPSQVLAPATLSVEPTSLSLGQLTIGSERSFDLHLQNLGMRLVNGAVDSDSPWLVVGGSGAHKSFQFLTEATMTVRIAGKHLRASAKPIEGHLLIESNAGLARITIRVDVPISPFCDGLFAGALTPRQIAEKARSDPQTAVPFFESGAVARWFTRNGWTYPVEGPAATGLGAVQQFFEALGLAKAPIVDVNPDAISFQGEPGQSLQKALEITSPEKKPVYAHATCEQLWVDCSKVKLAGRSALITVAVPIVPDRPGETLHARVTVKGNGNQVFAIPLSLTILRPSPFSLENDVEPPQKVTEAAPFPLLEGRPTLTTKPDAAPRLSLGIHLIPLCILLLVLTAILLRDVLRLFEH